MLNQANTVGGAGADSERRMADLRGVACVACGSETFEETDAGFYVCARCGTQSQDVRKDVDDEDAALSMGLVGRGARSRRVRDPARARLGADGRVIQRGGDRPKTADDVARERRAEADAIAARVRAYEEGLRRIAEAVCETLVRVHGADPTIRATAANVWRGYVAACGILAKDFGDPATYANPARRFGKRDGRGPTWINSERVATATTTGKGPAVSSTTAKGAAGDDDDDDDDDANEDSDRPKSSPSSSEDDDDDKEEDDRENANDDAAGNRSRDVEATPGKPLTLRRLVSRHLPRRLPLAVAYLACVLRRQPLHPADFTRWALEGDVPYVARAADVAKDLRALGADPEPWPNALTAPRAAPLPDKIAACAHDVASTLNVELPPCNALGLCARFASELGLHGDVADAAVRLLAAHESDGLRAHGSRTRGFVLRGTTRSRLPAAPPHVHAMAYVVAAINMLHGLDGRGAGGGAAGGGDVDADDAPGWRGRRTEARRAGRNATPATRRGRRSCTSANGSLSATGSLPAAEQKLTIDPPPRGGWVAWAERTMREGASAPRLPVRVAEAATRTPSADDDDGASASRGESVDAFLEYCRSHALRGLEGGLPEAHGRTVDALWRIHDARGADVPSDGPLVPPQSTAEHPAPGDSLSGRVDLDALSRRTGPIAAHLARRVSTRPSTRARASARPKLPLVARGTGFDPATSDPGSSDRPTDGPTEAYVAVVRACAGHAWADPQALHECALDVAAGFAACVRKDAGGFDERAYVEGLERRFLRVAEVPEFPEPASRVKEDVPDVPDVPGVPGEETKTKRRKSSAAAIMPPPPPRLPAVATASTTKARKRAAKKKRPARVDGF